MSGIRAINQQFYGKNGFEIATWAFTHPVQAAAYVYQNLSGVTEDDDLMYADSIQKGHNKEVIESHLLSDSVGKGKEFEALKNQDPELYWKIRYIADMKKGVDYRDPKIVSATSSEEISNYKTVTTAFNEKIRVLGFLDHIPNTQVKEWLDFIKKEAADQIKAANDRLQGVFTIPQIEIKFLQVHNKDELEHYAKLLDELRYLNTGEAAAWFEGTPADRAWVDQIGDLAGKSTPQLVGAAIGEVAKEGVKTAADVLGESLKAAGFDIGNPSDFFQKLASYGFVVGGVILVVWVYGTLKK
jgi:hypothetical protein